MVFHGSDGCVEFRFLRPDARAVCLAGDFNRWQNDGLSMEKGEDGWWSARLSLAPGVYQFRYQADGAWFNDYAAFGLEMGPFGWNSVVLVEEPVVSSSVPVSTVSMDAVSRRELSAAQSPVPAPAEKGDRQAA